MKEIRDKLAETKAVCVFREPQFDAKYVNVVLEGSKAKQGILDPIGSDITPGPRAYAALLANLAEYGDLYDLLDLKEPQRAKL